MNKKLKISANLIISFLLVIGFSCSGDKNTDNTSTSDVEIQQKPVSNIKVSYKLPSPVELFIFMKEHELPYNKKPLNEVDNVSKYLTNFSKYINFGIYASDLAYATVYSDQQQSFLYFSTVKGLADELGFAEGFDAIAATRIEQNSFNSDSLYQITSDAYWEACTYLENLGQESELSLIVSGGWIESVYLSIHSIPKFKENSPEVIRIAEQQILLDNLIEYLQSVNNISVQKVLPLLLKLQLKFDILYDNEDTNTIISEEQFNIISDEIDIVRNELIK